MYTKDHLDAAYVLGFNDGMNGAKIALVLHQSGAPEDAIATAIDRAIEQALNNLESDVLEVVDMTDEEDASVPAV